MALPQSSDPRFPLASGATGRAASADGSSAANPWREAAALLARQAQRHAGALLLAALVGAGLAGLAKTVLPANYKATAQILIDSQQSDALAGDASGSRLDSSSAINYVESQMGVIGSDRVLMRVIREQGLAGEPAAAPSESEEAEGSARASSAADPAENRALVVLQKAVTITRAERSFLVGLTVANDDPQQAARLANALVKAYGDVNRIDRNASARKVAAELDKRIDELRRQLDAGAAHVLAFKNGHDLVGLNDRSIAERMTFEATDALSAAQNREAQARSRLAQLETALTDVGGVPALGSDPESRQLQALIEARVAAAAELERLAGSLGDRHPALEAARLQLNGFDRRIALSLQGLRRAARAQLAEAQGQTAALEQKVAGLAAEMTRAREYDAPLHEMEDALAAKRKALTEWETRRREANDMSQGEDVSFRVVSPARAPIAKNPAASLVVWALSGALAGVALALAALAMGIVFEDSAQAPQSGGAGRRDEKGLPPQPAPAVVQPASNRPAAAPVAAKRPAAGLRRIPGSRVAALGKAAS